MATSNSPPSTREQYPHRELGIVLFIIGILLLVLAVVLAAYCQPTSYPSVPPYPSPPSQCNYPYAGGAVLLGLLGVILLFVGIALMVSRNPAIPATPPNVVYHWPAYPVWPAPPPPPQLACTKCGRIYQVGQHLFCPNCGTKLGSSSAP